MKLEGIISYPITPFNREGTQIDYTALITSIERLIENQSDAIAPLGSTGESAYLTWDEWVNVAQKSVETVNGRVPVIIGISELTTDLALKKAQIAENVGADAIMVIPVSYWKLSDQEIYDYYKEIAAATTLPIMVYNNPATSGIDMSPELIVHLFKTIENIKMVKESTGDIQRMHRIYELSEGKLPFYNGCNPLALEAFCAGASGWCTAAPNLLGKQPKAIYQAIKDHNLPHARSVFFKQLPLLRFIVQKGLPKTIKAGLNELGYPVGIPRLPIQAVNSDELIVLKSLLNQAQSSCTN